jgi:2-C-methyl-D-erythritol 4-phosphate cytidylyltransferase
MLNENRIGGLLLMAGWGLRFGSEIPKQFHRLSGKPVYRVTLEAFLQAGFFDEIVLSCHPDWFEIVSGELAQMQPSIPIRIAAGGKTRQESSAKGLQSFQIPPSIVLIHDAVRPFISTAILKSNALLAIQHGAVDTCIPSADTLVHAPNGQRIESIPNRSEYYRGQTPQSFSYPLIVNAHAKTTKTDSSDDCRLVMELGHPVFLAQGDEHNIKITSELDLFLAEQLFRLRKDSLPNATKSLEGKRYAVVGGTGGIGAAICHSIVQAGGIAIPLSRKTSPPLDLQEPVSINAAFATLGSLDGLINCAGFLLTGSLADLSFANITKTLDINLQGLIFCCKTANLKTHAHLITIASSSFTKGRKDTSVYSCAKAAVVNFTQALAEERPDLFVHAVIPGRTHTQMRLSNFPHEDASHLLSPKQVAEAVLRLLMDTTSTGLLVEVKKFIPFEKEKIQFV